MKKHNERNLPMRPFIRVWVMGFACAVFTLAWQGTGRAVEARDVSTVRTVAWTTAQGGEPIAIIQNSSQVLRFDRNIVRAAISNPDICDITTIGERDVLVNAKKTGVVNLLLWDDRNEIASYSLESTLNLERLSRVLRAIDEGSELQIVPFNDTAAVYGTVETSLKLKQVDATVKAFDKNALSFVRLKESKQILLEVRFAEVNRKANSEFKFDLEAIGKEFAFRGLTGQTGASIPLSDSRYTPAGSPVTYNQIGLPNENMANLYGAYVSNKLLVSNFLKFLEQKNVLKIIARPNLVAKDGEEASFIVGGEFPVPVATRDGIEINYKEFGTKLKFIPEALDKGMIRLNLETEVSELDFSTTLVVNGSTVPSLIKRNQKTIAELADNQSLVIGGLITQKINKVNRKVPGLGDIPIAGKLFNSDTVSRTDVELLIVITPNIVRPIELGESKRFYDGTEVSEAIRPFTPPYADQHADTIDNLLMQEETRRNFDEPARKKGSVRKEKTKREEKVVAPAPAAAAPANQGLFPGGQAGR
jgi:pilus assembly protein CpaC